MRRLWLDYRHAYVDCSDWLATWLAPWRWLLTFCRQSADLRRNPPKES